MLPKDLVVAAKELWLQKSWHTDPNKEFGSGLNDLKIDLHVLIIQSDLASAVLQKRNGQTFKFLCL